MNKGIIFIGGVHGVGKGTLCKRLASDLKITHLSASEVLKWSDFNADSSNKQVADISATQDRLLMNLGKLIQPNETYLLDGHFCLLNKGGKIEKVPNEVFVGINPKKIVVICENPEIICEHLFQRDGKNYDVSQIKQMQIIEREHAQHIAELLRIPMYEIQSSSLIVFITIEQPKLIRNIRV